MLFSTPVFIFVFLPGVLFGYYVIFRNKRKLQNIFLTFCSLFFYAWGEPWFVLVMIASIIANWGIALWAEKYREKHRLFIALAVTVNLANLFVFKYLSFVLYNINALSGNENGISVPDIRLPIGISFFTFQALSYTLDVCNGRNSAKITPLNIALYISFFPQLIAGPIVRYGTIADQIDNRKETFDAFSEGICRFVVGLAKKIILANNLASVADAAFAANERSVVFAWLGALAYTFQICYDFSGYSDMAIGLGKMFGFHFLENFNYPYISKSVSEFWRRWHISLGTWFRDYVYFPMGGSRVNSKARLIFNLFTVWMLTGLWHGANWTFIIWGLMYFALVTIEKLSHFDKKVLQNKILVIFGHAYTLFFIVIGWVIFKADSVAGAISYIKSLFGISATGFYSSIDGFWFLENRYFYLLAIIFSMPLAKRISNMAKRNKVMQLGYPLLIAILFLITISYVIKGMHNPFIYFNF